MTELEGSSDAALLASLRRAQGSAFRAFVVALPPNAYHDEGKTLVDTTRRRLDALRAAGGDHADFVLAGAGDLSTANAAELARALEPYNLLWFDEPCGVSDLAALREINGTSVTPLGFGRQIHESPKFLELLREGVVDVIRPDLGLNGMLQVRRMAALAETCYVAAAPRHDGGPVATAAALHLAAALPNFFIQQIPFPEAEEDRRMRAELAGDSIEKIEDGFARLPVGDGLGITVSEEALEKYRERAS
jgi:galactonate dehydratase